MTPATWPRPQPLSERLLYIDPAGTYEDRRLVELPDLLRPGDLLVVNDAATLPASLHGHTSAGAEVEVRLAGRNERTWTAILFGAGDWRMRTEDRPPPPSVRAGERLQLAAGLSAVVLAVDPATPRLIEIEFDRDGEHLWPALYQAGRPVQYSYLQAPLPLWHTQTAYAARPWAMEAPSAGRPLTWELLGRLRRRGIGIASVTHAAGLSSTGDAALDARLPLPERFEVAPATVDAVAETRERNARVIAVGTTVVRALESAALGGTLRAQAGDTRLRIGPGFRPQVVDSLLTGMHEPDSSHFALLAAFAPPDLLAAAHAHAEVAGYLGHEFGDVALVLH